MFKKYDLIVIGAGHAGCEAALASARMGASTLLLTISIENVALMPCNPAIGGIGKGNLVKDMDALGGEMGLNIDATGIQFRILNRSKGVAVRATRAQADKYLYKDRMLTTIFDTPNLDLKQGIVTDININNNEVESVSVASGEQYFCKKIVITAGTFIDGHIYIGSMRMSAGRMYEPASVALGESLTKLGLNHFKMKTDTPARIRFDSIDISGLEVLSSDSGDITFSGEGIKNNLKNIDCYLTYTNDETCRIVADNIKASQLYSGEMAVKGPRYCPSIEDKIKNFPEKTSHNIVIEPESLDMFECHINGMSTSLPYDIQVAAYRSIKGLENAVFTRPAYAIEYNVYDPKDLHYSYESKKVKGLYLAGQLNGTSGYEEAAVQGFMAGVNAVLSIDNKEPLILGRDESYIGVLGDDIISKGVDEPYRMFTSRGEYRLLLREDRAEARLLQYGYEKLGLIRKERYDRFLNDRELIDLEIRRLIKLKDKDKNISYHDLLKRPEVLYRDMIKESGIGAGNLSEKLIDQLEVEIKYKGYIDKEQKEVEKASIYDDILVPNSISYKSIPGLRLEYAEKIALLKPKTLKEIRSIPGISPSAISVIAIEISKIVKTENI